MKKLKSIVEKLLEGQTVKGFKNLSLYDIRELERIYNDLKEIKKAEFINGNCKTVLESCNIKVNNKGIGFMAIR